MVRGTENEARKRIVKYCTINKVDPGPYFLALEAAPRIDADKIPFYWEALRTVAALAKQFCQARDVRAEQYKVYIRLTRNRTEIPFLVKSALNYVSEHLQEPFIVKDIASHLNCHPDYLSSQFKKYMHVELGSYIRRRRIDHAMYLLVNSKVTIDQVSERCGFADRVYFGKVFRGLTGMTPGEYRRHALTSPN